MDIHISGTNIIARMRGGDTRYDLAQPNFFKFCEICAALTAYDEDKFCLNDGLAEVRWLLGNAENRVSWYGELSYFAMPWRDVYGCGGTASNYLSLDLSIPAVRTNGKSIALTKDRPAEDFLKIVCASGWGAGRVAARLRELFDANRVIEETGDLGDRENWGGWLLDICGVAPGYRYQQRLNDVLLCRWDFWDGEDRHATHPDFNNLDITRYYFNACVGLDQTCLDPDFIKFLERS